MQVYTVIDVNQNTRVVALRDHGSRYHAAHFISILPAVGDELQGSLPERGFTLLIRSDGGSLPRDFQSNQLWRDWGLRRAASVAGVSGQKAYFGLANGRSLQGCGWRHDNGARAQLAAA